MRAIAYDRYGPPEVLHPVEAEDPVPQDDEVRVRVRATTVSTGDVNARSFAFVPSGFKLLARLMMGVRGPRNRILGVEFAGEVDAVGDDVDAFQVGDPVYGIDGERMGAYAELKCIPASGALAPAPSGLTLEEAAAIPFGATTALHFLREMGDIQEGDAILVNGASGSVGSATVQIAAAFGAEVTGVCSTRNLDLVRSLGADHVIDYTEEDFTDGDARYDLVLDAVYGGTSFRRSKRVLNDGGRYLAVAGGGKEILQAGWTKLVGGKQVKMAMDPYAAERKEALWTITELVEGGRYRPVIDRRYPMEEVVEAHRYVDGGHKRGNVVLTWDGDGMGTGIDRAR